MRACFRRQVLSACCCLSPALLPTLLTPVVGQRRVADEPRKVVLVEPEHVHRVRDVAELCCGVRDSVEIVAVDVEDAP